MVTPTMNFYITSALNIISGTLLTILLKQISLISPNDHQFTHPYFMTSLMFLSESTCLLLSYISKSPQQNLLTNPPLSKKSLFIIPAFLDLCSATCILIALELSSASITQMMRGFIIIITCAYSKIFLKSKIFKHQIIGIILVCSGLTIIGFASLINTANTAKNPALGIFFALFSKFLSGGIFVIEQVLLKELRVGPLEAVGLEGIFGLGMYLALLPVLNLIPCHNENLCNQGFVENSVEAISEVFSSFSLFFLIFLSMVLTLILNVAGVNLTKISGALARTIVDNSRTVFVWIACMLIGWEEFSWIQLVGFVVLLTGTFIYNEILVLEMFGIQQSVELKKKGEKNDKWVEMNEN